MAMNEFPSGANTWTTAFMGANPQAQARAAKIKMAEQAPLWAQLGLEAAKSNQPGLANHYNTYANAAMRPGGTIDANGNIVSYGGPTRVISPQWMRKNAITQYLANPLNQGPMAQQFRQREQDKNIAAAEWAKTQATGVTGMGFDNYIAAHDNASKTEDAYNKGMATVLHQADNPPEGAHTMWTEIGSNGNIFQDNHNFILGQNPYTNSQGTDTEIKLFK